MGKRARETAGAPPGEQKTGGRRRTTGDDDPVERTDPEHGQASRQGPVENRVGLDPETLGAHELGDRKKPSAPPPGGERMSDDRHQSSLESQNAHRLDQQCPGIDALIQDMDQENGVERRRRKGKRPQGLAEPPGDEPPARERSQGEGTVVGRENHESEMPREAGEERPESLRLAAAGPRVAAGNSAVRTHMKRPEGHFVSKHPPGRLSTRHDGRAPRAGNHGVQISHALSHFVFVGEAKDLDRREFLEG